MAELILTDEERAAATYLEWDDTALGKFTKNVALWIQEHRNDAKGLHKVTAASAAMLLVGTCLDCNATELTLKLDGFEHCDVPAGDWIITVMKKEAA